MIEKERTNERTKDKNIYVVPLSDVNPTRNLSWLITSFIRFVSSLMFLSQVYRRPVNKKDEKQLRMVDDNDELSKRKEIETKERKQTTIIMYGNNIEKRWKKQLRNRSIEMKAGRLK